MFGFLNKSSTQRDACQSSALQRQRMGLVLALVSAALFSFKGVIVKLAIEYDVPIETLMLWRMGMALPVYMAVGFYVIKPKAKQAGQTDQVAQTSSFKSTQSSESSQLSNQKPQVTRLKRYILAACALGILSYYICTWLDFSGLQYISAQFGRMILFTYPTLTAFLAWMLIGEKLTRRHVYSLAISYAGVLLVFGSEWQVLGQGAILGVGYVFAAALLFALYVIYAKVVIQHLGSTLFTCVAMVAATLAIVIHNGIRMSSLGLLWSQLWMPPALIAGGVLAVVCTVAPSFMLSEAISRIGPGRTSAAGNIGPVVTTLLAVWLLQEPFGWPQAIGMVLILLGVRLIARQK